MKVFDIVALANSYEQFRVGGYDEKWLNYIDFQPYIDQLNVAKEVIGKSFLEQSITKISVGAGKKRLLIWSQMHGNESTGTRAMMDVLSFLEQPSAISKRILETLTIDFIPMLNPDGANINTRRNAVGIDMNRDFLAKQSTEIHVLLEQVAKEDYKVLFNLHDQRTIFNVGTTNETATLSFLAPSFNKAEDVNEVRQQTMGIIQAMNTEIQQLIPGKVGRYTSEFYPRSTGDNFTLMGYPTVLIEAGHFPDDYERNVTRKYNALAIISGLFSLTEDSVLPFDTYEDIPQNGQRFLDIILRNVKIVREKKSSIVDLGIYFEEEYNPSTDRVQRMGYLTDIGDLSALIGHIDLQTDEAIYEDGLTNIPFLGQKANFKVGEWVFMKGNLMNK